MARTLRIRFNLAEVLAQGSFTAAQRRALAPFIRSDAVKREFGLEAIDAIVDRTQGGRDVNGDKFQAYSPNYFKSGTPDLTLTGDMLGSVHIIQQRGPTVTIGFPNNVENKKARRHNFGLAKMPRREFFDLSIDDQSQILKDIIRQSNALGQIEAIEEAIRLSGSNTEVGAILSEAEEAGDLPQDVLAELATILPET